MGRPGKWPSSRLADLHHPWYRRHPLNASARLCRCRIPRTTAVFRTYASSRPRATQQPGASLSLSSEPTGRKKTATIDPSTSSDLGLPSPATLRAIVICDSAYFVAWYSLINSFRSRTLHFTLSQSRPRRITPSQSTERRTHFLALDPSSFGRSKGEQYSCEVNTMAHIAGTGCYTLSGRGCGNTGLWDKLPEEKDRWRSRSQSAPITKQQLQP